MGSYYDVLVYIKLDLSQKKEGQNARKMDENFHPGFIYILRFLGYITFICTDESF